MPDDHGQKKEHENELIKTVEQDGWDYFPDTSNWVVNADESDGIHSAMVGFEAAEKITTEVITST